MKQLWNVRKLKIKYAFHLLLNQGNEFLHNVDRGLPRMRKEGTKTDI